MSRRTRNKPVNMPIMPAMCATCPFRDGSGTEYLRQNLTISALSEGSRICHSTGSNNAFHGRTGTPEHLCRGARDEQLRFFHAIKVIDEPTDEAWEKKVIELGLRKKK